MNYIISLKHTSKSDSAFTLWRPANKGYCQSLNSAGLYDIPEKGYHDSDDNLPVETELAERLGSTVTFDGELKTIIPVNKYTMKDLCLKFKGRDIVRI